MKQRFEIVFNVEEADEGGYIAEALGEDIITEADTLEELKENMREAVICHFADEAMIPNKQLLTNIGLLTKTSEGLTFQYLGFAIKDLAGGSPK